MITTVPNNSHVGSTARPERREHARFRLKCPVRLLRSGRPIGDSHTRDISCESFSCILPDREDIVTCGEVLECEIELITPAGQVTLSRPPLLRCEAMVMRVSAVEHDSLEVVCRLLNYNIL